MDDSTLAYQIEAYWRIQKNPDLILSGLGTVHFLKNYAHPFNDKNKNIIDNYIKWSLEESAHNSPVSLLVSTHKALGYEAFNEIGAYPIRLAGLIRGYSAVDGGVSGPIGFYIHDIEHMGPAGERKIKTMEEFNIFRVNVLNRTRKVDHLLASVDAVRDKILKDMLHFLIFCSWHEKQGLLSLDVVSSFILNDGYFDSAVEKIRPGYFELKPGATRVHEAREWLRSFLHSSH